MTLEAAIKWVLLTLLAIICWTWILLSGFRVDFAYYRGLGWISALLSIALFYYYTGRDQRIVNFAHFASQIVSLYALLVLFNYLAVSTNAPLLDDTFNAVDKLLGLDWVAWTQWVISHPNVRRVLKLAYDSLPFQMFFCYVYNTCKGTDWRNNEIWWITFISAVITILIGAAVPATNPYVYYGLEGSDHFIHTKIFSGLRDGTMSILKLSIDEGLVQLPSFHTVLAIMFTYNLRQNRWLFAIACIINTLLILACASEGCHYFIDMPAGIVVAVGTIWLVRRLGKLFAWQQPAAITQEPLFGHPLALQRMER